MDISPDLPTTTPADAGVGAHEHEQAPDVEVDAFLAAERTANDYHP